MTWLQERADYWNAMCSAVALTRETGLQPFQNPTGWMGSVAPPPKQSFTPAELDEAIDKQQPVLNSLLEAVVEKAPSLCRPSALLPLARLAAWTDSEQWVRPLNDWAGEAKTDVDNADDADEREAAALRSLAAHLLEKWDVPPALHGALTFVDGPPTSEAAHRISLAFLEVHAAAGAGAASVLAALRTAVSPTVSKSAAKEFVKLGVVGTGGEVSKGDDDDAKEEVVAAAPMANPLHALRRAQVLSLGGESWVADAACESRLGGAILRTEGGEGEKEEAAASVGTGPSEEYALMCLDWIVRHQSQLDSPYVATSLLNFFFEMRSIDPTYTCVGRTPKTVSAALEAYTATTVDFGSAPDESFQPNPRGLKGLFQLQATIPAGTVVEVPYYYNSGEEKLGGKGQKGSSPAAIRIAEILSLQRLFYEGEMLDNCLQGARGSQAKYLSRARARVSSFWSLTKQEPGKDVEYMCLIEVWHLGQGRNEIRQAEGPRPRTIPDAEAWYWMDKWCTQEGIDLSTWDCYS